MLYICIFSNKLDLNQAICVSHILMKTYWLARVILLLVALLAKGTAFKGREPKTCSGLSSKLGCFDDVHVLIFVDARPHLQLKTQPRISPVS